jgi:hypothetical protein
VPQFAQLLWGSQPCSVGWGDEASPSAGDRGGWALGLSNSRWRGTRAARAYPARSFSFLSVMPSLDTSLLNTRIPITMFTCRAEAGCGPGPCVHWPMAATPWGLAGYQGHSSTSTTQTPGPARRGASVSPVLQVSPHGQCPDPLTLPEYRELLSSGPRMPSPVCLRDLSFLTFPNHTGPQPVNGLGWVPVLGRLSGSQVFPVLLPKTGAVPTHHELPLYPGDPGLPSPWPFLLICHTCPC